MVCALAAAALASAGVVAAAAATARARDETPSCKVPTPAGGANAARAYSGVNLTTPIHGIAATIWTLQQPNVPTGTNVAAWVGVSSSVGWVQAGLVDSSRGRNIYFEYRQGPSGSPVCFARLALDPAQPHRFAVLETAHAAGVWRVWIDGKPRGQEVKLPSSPNQFFTATAEAVRVDPEAPAPTYAYRFAGVRQAQVRGGVWRPLRSPQPVGAALIGQTGDDFTVASLSP